MGEGPLDELSGETSFESAILCTGDKILSACFGGISKEKGRARANARGEKSSNSRWRCLLLNPELGSDGFAGVVGLLMLSIFKSFKSFLLLFVAGVGFQVLGDTIGLGDIRFPMCCLLET
jgi:hypothetical protein